MPPEIDLASPTFTSDALQRIDRWDAYVPILQPGLLLAAPLILAGFVALDDTKAATEYDYSSDGQGGDPMWWFVAASLALLPTFVRIWRRLLKRGAIAVTRWQRAAGPSVILSLGGHHAARRQLQPDVARSWATQQTDAGDARAVMASHHALGAATGPDLLGFDLISLAVMAIAAGIRADKRAKVASWKAAALPAANRDLGVLERSLVDKLARTRRRSKRGRLEVQLGLTRQARAALRLQVDPTGVTAASA